MINIFKVEINLIKLYIYKENIAKIQINNSFEKSSSGPTHF